MKQIVQYKSEDGKIFSCQNECTEYELFYDTDYTDVKYILPTLDLDANEGKQHDHGLAKFTKFKTKLVALVVSQMNDEKAKQWGAINPMEISPMCFLGRYIDDSAYGNSLQGRKWKLINNLWHRLMCLDKDGWEYGQPYYAKHNYL